MNRNLGFAKCEIEFDEVIVLRFQLFEDFDEHLLTNLILLISSNAAVPKWKTDNIRVKFLVLEFVKDRLKPFLFAGVNSNKTNPLKPNLAISELHLENKPIEDRWMPTVKSRSSSVYEDCNCFADAWMMWSGRDRQKTLIGDFWLLSVKSKW
jgi:hypothetical protein